MVAKLEGRPIPDRNPNQWVDCMKNWFQFKNDTYGKVEWWWAGGGQEEVMMLGGHAVGNDAYDSSSSGGRAMDEMKWWHLEGMLWAMVRTILWVVVDRRWQDKVTMLGGHTVGDGAHNSLSVGMVLKSQLWFGGTWYDCIYQWCAWSGSISRWSPSVHRGGVAARHCTHYVTQLALAICSTPACSRSPNLITAKSISSPSDFSSAWIQDSSCTWALALFGSIWALVKENHGLVHLQKHSQGVTGLRGRQLRWWLISNGGGSGVSMQCKIGAQQRQCTALLSHCDCLLGCCVVRWLS